MRLTRKGQVTIPQALREQCGLQPGTEVTFAAAAGGVVVKATAAERVRRLRAAIRKTQGSAKGGFTTDELMRLTRGDDD